MDLCWVCSYIFSSREVSGLHPTAYSSCTPLTALLFIFAAGQVAGHGFMTNGLRAVYLFSHSGEGDTDWTSVRTSTSSVFLPFQSPIAQVPCNGLSMNTQRLHIMVTQTLMLILMNNRDELDAPRNENIVRMLINDCYQLPRFAISRR